MIDVVRAIPSTINTGEPITHYLRLKKERLDSVDVDQAYITNAKRVRESSTGFFFNIHHTDFFEVSAFLRGDEDSSLPITVYSRLAYGSRSHIDYSWDSVHKVYLAVEAANGMSGLFYFIKEHSLPSLLEIIMLGYIRDLDVVVGEVTFNYNFSDEYLALEAMVRL